MAKAGCKHPMDKILQGYKSGLVTKNDLEKILRKNKESVDEMKRAGRESFEGLNCAYPELKPFIEGGDLEGHKQCANSMIRAVGTGRPLPTTSTTYSLFKTKQK